MSTLSQWANAVPPRLIPDAQFTNILASSQSTFQKPTQVANPILPTDAVNKQYVDGVIPFPGGINQEIQYAENNLFTGSPNLKWDYNTNKLNVTGQINAINGTNIGQLIDNSINFISGATPQVTATATSNQLTFNGATPITTVLLSGVTNPVNLQDVATKNYVDTHSTSPGGTNTDIQFNNGGVFGGSSNLTWDGTTLTATNILGLPSVSAPYMTVTSVPNDPNAVTNRSFVQAQIGSAPGLPAAAVQFNSNPAGTFSGSPNFVWNNVLNQLTVNGQIIAQDVMAVSDVMLKSNITPLDNEQSLNLLSKIKCFKYNLLDQEQETYGVLAQQLEEIGLSNIVNKGNEYKSVAYMQLITLLIAAINKINEKIDKKIDEKVEPFKPFDSIPVSFLPREIRLSKRLSTKR